LVSGKDPTKTNLFDFLSSKLSGSSLEVIRKTDSEIVLQGGDLISITINTNDEDKALTYELFSQKLGRSVGVEEIQGVEFLESGLETELEKEKNEGIEADTLVALDLLRLWAKEAGSSAKLTVSEEASKRQVAQPKKRGPKPKS
jgi:hypothetical protein